MWERRLRAAIQSLMAIARCTAGRAPTALNHRSTAGSAAAHYCAAAGLSVLLLETSSFPRDKICGDGLTPRAVAEL